MEFVPAKQWRIETVAGRPRPVAYGNNSYDFIVLMYDEPTFKFREKWIKTQSFVETRPCRSVASNSAGRLPWPFTINTSDPFPSRVLTSRYADDHAASADRFGYTCADTHAYRYAYRYIHPRANRLPKALR
jgi:hypothetical protein